VAGLHLLYDWQIAKDGYRSQLVEALKKSNLLKLAQMVQQGKYDAVSPPITQPLGVPQTPPANVVSPPITQPLGVPQTPPANVVSPPITQPLGVPQTPPVMTSDRCNNEMETNQLTEIAKPPMKSHFAAQLDPVRSDWKKIGVQLEIEDGDLASIEKNSSLDDSDKLSRVFQLWMDQETTEVSWKKILEVIRTPPISNLKLHQELVKFLSRDDIKLYYK
jgi:hypothetical protein